MNKNKLPTDPGEVQMDVFNQDNSDFSKQQSVNMPATITITVPVTFLGDLYFELPDNVYQDVIGFFYFSENLPPNVAEELREKDYHKLDL